MGAITTAMLKCAQNEVALDLRDRSPDEDGSSEFDVWLHEQDAGSGGSSTVTGWFVHTIAPGILS
jgi:hypothetical protein